MGMSLLEGIRVLEFGMLLNADTIGMRLGDFGADVIKVEMPPVGDYIRDLMGTISPGHSPAHLQVNKNKRSLSLDMRKDGAKDLFWRLFDTADIFVDGYLAGGLDRLGVGYDVQKARKPSIVHCSYTGFGAVGPYSRVPTHGWMMDALGAGKPQVMGEDGFLRSPPMEGHLGTMSGGEATSAGASHATMAILAGLVNAIRTGEGCYIDVAGSDAEVAQGWINATNALNEHRVTHPDMPPMENGGMIGARLQFYQCADGKNVLFGAMENKFWVSFCRVAEREDLIDASLGGQDIDYGLDDNLRHTIQGIFHAKTQSEWMELAVKHKIPIGPAPRDVVEMRDDPHAQARGLVFDAHHPVVGEFTYVGAAPQIAGHPYELRYPAPEFGQDTDQILSELKVSPEEIEQLRGAGVLG